MKYADPHACPACRGRIDGQPRCPHCGLLLRGAAALELWRQMERLDALVARAQQVEPASRPATPTPTSAPLAPPAAQGPAPSPPDRPRPAAASAPTPPPRGVNAGAVVLALGTLLLLVAATIFISVSWEHLGLFGRSLVLFAATAAAAFAASLASWRRLRASAEALWTVAFGLLTLDWFAARAEGLAALDRVPGEIHLGAWALLMGLLGIPIARLAGRPFGRPLLMVQLTAGAAPWIAAPPVLVYLWDTAGWRPFWAGAVAGLLVLLAVALGWRLRASVALYVALPLMLVGVPFLMVAALVDAIAHPQLGELFLDAHGAPLVVVSLLAASATLVLPHGRVAAAATAVLSAEALVIAAVAGETSEGIAAVVVAVLLAVGALVVRGHSVWGRGTQAALAVSAGAAALVILAGWWGEAFDALTVAALTVGVAITVWGARRWTVVAVPALLVRPGVVVVLACGLLATAAALMLSLAAQVALGLVIASLVAFWFGRGTRVEQWVGPLLFLVALAPASGPSAAWASVFAAAAYAALSATSTWRLFATVTAVLSALCAAAAGVAFSDAFGLDARAASLWLTAVAVAAFGVACWFIDDIARRIALEITAGLVLFSGLLTGVEVGQGAWSALLFLMVSLALFGAAFDVPDRRWYAVPAVISAVLAWLCFVVGEQFAAVEALTVPLAAVALGVGAWFMHRDARVRTAVALGVGLALAFLPSLPQALSEPTSLRAWLLGGAALVALAVGWWRTWQAPFVTGAIVLALLILVNLWPVAMAVERWVLFAVLGIVLLAIGVTWESRVRQGRAAWRVVADMR